MGDHYDISLQELRTLMEFRGAEAKEEVLKLGGPEAITEKLKVRRRFLEDTSIRIVYLTSFRVGTPPHKTIVRRQVCYHRQIFGWTP